MNNWRSFQKSITSLQDQPKRDILYIWKQLGRRREPNFNKRWQLPNKKPWCIYLLMQPKWCLFFLTTWLRFGGTRFLLTGWLETNQLDMDLSKISHLDILVPRLIHLKFVNMSVCYYNLYRDRDQFMRTDKQTCRQIKYACSCVRTAF